MLGERREEILSLIIDQYIKTGEPIGSKTLCQMLPYAISSATIRNEMAHLSQLGYLEQRHTSGGRVPSKASYRYYVDRLMHTVPLNDREKQKINEALSTNASDTERLFADASKLLADITNCTAFYSIIEDGLDCIQGIQLIPAGGGKVMLVMLTVGGKIKSSICKLNCPINEEFTRAFYSVVNTFFIGKPLMEVNLATIQNTVTMLGAKIFDMLPVLTSLCSLCDEAAKSNIHITGETNLLSHDELGEDVYRLLTFFANRERFLALSKSFANNNKNSLLLIGDENPQYEMRNTATLMAKFEYSGNQKATLGIIGSTRIDYAAMLPRVQYIIKSVYDLLNEGGITNG